jgi:hypothetical protein
MGKPLLYSFLNASAVKGRMDSIEKIDCQQDLILPKISLFSNGFYVFLMLQIFVLPQRSI